MSDFVIEKGVLTKYTGTDRDVVIPESVTSIGDWAFAHCSSLTSITIPASVTSIGDGASLGCLELADENGFVVVRDTVYDCKENVKRITIPEGVTRIGESAF